jgi:hypothetical protein
VWLRRSSRRSAMSVAIVERDRDPAPERRKVSPRPVVTQLRVGARVRA